ncbi:MAG: ABC transporter ATP-binding protein [Chloroflexi bacterium]|nr:ABC transporter ATP-binding protein [Chloroflexota bacterium]
MADGNGNTPLLQVKDLKTYLFTRYAVVRAVDGITFDLKEGENLGLVGESGCGKTMTGLSLLRLLPQPAGRIVGGQIIFDGQDILTLDDDEFRKLRGTQMSMILQDPMTSLNPVFTIGDQVGEPLLLHQGLKGNGLKDKVVELLRLVRIPVAEVRVRDFPHQMSGGMRQRIVGAIAMSCNPKLLIADEPTTALDVTTQIYFLKLMRELQQQFGMAMIWITHDFGIVNRMCDRIAVMYAGRFMEIGPLVEMFKRPVHPYTIALLNSVPRVDRKVDQLYSIEGQPPDLRQEMVGCPFAPRCSRVKPICREQYPDEVVLDSSHKAYCWDVK